MDSQVSMAARTVVTGEAGDDFEELRIALLLGQRQFDLTRLKSRVRAARTNTGLTQGEVAFVIGMTRASVNRFEARAQDWSVSQSLAGVRVVGLDFANAFGDDDA